MKKYLWIVVIVVVVLIVVGVVSQKPTETGPIKLGFISALSGDAAVVGEIEKNTTEMAIKEINDAGGVNGRQLEVIYEDAKCNAKDALNAVQKLINMDKVKVILGAGCSSESLAIVPVATANKVLMFSAGSSHPDLTGISKYFIRNYPSDYANSTIDGELMSKLYKKVAIVSENADYPMGIKKSLEEIFQKNNIQIVSNEVFNTGNSNTKDFKSIFTKIKASGAEAVYLNPAPGATISALMVKQARDIGLMIPVHGNTTVISAEAIKIAGKYMEGAISSDSTTLSEKGLAVLEKYKKLYGKEPALAYFMGSNYDRAYLIAEAIGKVGYDADKIVAYLKSIKEYDGTIGKYHFADNGDVVGVGFRPVMVKDGKEVPYVQQ